MIYDDRVVKGRLRARMVPRRTRAPSPTRCSGTWSTSLD